MSDRAILIFTMFLFSFTLGMLTAEYFIDRAHVYDARKGK